MKHYNVNRQTGRNLARARRVSELLNGVQFRHAIEVAGLKPTRRQARKFLRARGAAFAAAWQERAQLVEAQ